VNGYCGRHYQDHAADQREDYNFTHGGPVIAQASTLSLLLFRSENGGRRPNIGRPLAFPPSRPGEEYCISDVASLRQARHLLELQDQLLESSHYIVAAAVAGSLIELTGDMAPGMRR